MRLGVAGRVVGLAMLALGGLPAPAAASACDPASTVGADLAEPVELCEVTTVQGSGGEVVRVSVPRDATLSLQTSGFVGRYQDVDLAGDGPVVGFVLSDNASEYLYVSRLRDDLHSGLYPDVWTGTFPQLGSETLLIPAGEYSLYLIGEGSALSATIRLGNLMGEVVISPRRSTELDLRVLDDRLPAPLGMRNVYSAGDEGALHGDGLVVLSAARSQQGIEAGDAWGTCFYFGSPAPEETAYLPGCPAGVMPGVDVATFQGAGVYPITTVQWLLSAVEPAGAYAPGIWFTVPTPVDRGAALALWLNYEQ